MNNKIFNLPVLQQLTPVISLSQQDELPILVISHAKFRAAIALQGAHLLSWQPSGQQDVIWLSEKSVFKHGVAIRGGIPICWPWFGPAQQPQHGFARTSTWQLISHDEDSDQVSLTLMLQDNAQTREYWPHSFTLLADFTFSEQCSIKLASQGNYHAYAALHSYFRIGAIEQITLAGLGNQFIDQLAQGTLKAQHGELTIKGRIDRIYTQANTATVINDPSLRRNIEIHHQQMSDVVVWNPGAELAEHMADMTNDGFNQMVCVETARINTPLIADDSQPAHLAVNICTQKIPPT
ncbi:D-hexose-6-phosphate mutarotase [Serratia microhaemolytica]|uniref:D-hexose-6-phosphate mutarotase n=1 Tax=Serratia microhaemolytica TaxID=2675110 RepID=UPI000FDCFC34|nr:D-hexose-6-phosphate mutarotase [Serratia microhaemolytica]